MPSAVQLQLHLLGGFRVIVGDRPIRVFTPRQTSLLAYLALAPGYRLHRERLMDTLWPDHDLDAQTNNLNVTIHAIRKRLVLAGVPAGTFLIREGEMVVLGPAEAITVDVVAFDAAVARAWNDDDPTITQAACDLYVGDLVPELPYDDQLEARRTTLRASVLALLARLGSQYVQAGQIDAAIVPFTGLVSLEPTHEEAHVALMRLYGLVGQPRASLDQYEQFAVILARDLDAEPQPDTQALAEAIREGRFPETTRQLVPDDAVVAARQDVSRPRLDGLPAPLNDLIGRERAIAEVCQLLATNRLVTLTGPGGVGKTRLALGIAHAVADHFADGAVFVPLDRISDASLVIPAISSTLGVRDAPTLSILESLVGALSHRQLLVVVDNMEHLVDAAGELATLLESCARLTVLATSRTPLRVSGEKDYPVAPLAVPDSTSTSDVNALATTPSVSLFVMRAQAVRHDFQITPTNASAVAQVCYCLDGLPLAIELAASRIRLFTPAELLRRFDHMLPVLDVHARNVPERHQTLRRAIAWSYDLLNKAEQRLFRVLSGFRSGWSLDAAEAISSRLGDTSDVINRLDALIAHSLVRAIDTRDGGRRYDMLSTIREFGAEQLEASGEANAVRDALAAYLVQYTGDIRTALVGPDQQRLLRSLEADHDNIRMALQWLINQCGGDAALQLTRNMTLFWDIRGFQREGEASILSALSAMPDADKRLRAVNKFWRGGFLTQLGRHAEARYTVAESMAMFRDLDDRIMMASCANGLGVVSVGIGDITAARAFFEEALWATRDTTERGDRAAYLLNLGWAHVLADDINAAVLRLSEALELAQHAGDTELAGQATLNLAWVSLINNDLQSAACRVSAALAIAQSVDSVSLVADCLCACCALAVSAGVVSAVPRLYAASCQIRADLGVTLPAVEEALIMRYVNHAREIVSETDWQRCIADGRKMSLTEVIDMARGVADVVN